MAPAARSREVAFVLGGGGVLGAHEVGMLRALAESDVEPDLVLGTSIGAVNGAFYAADPTLSGVERLTQLWRDSSWAERSAGATLRRLGTLARSGTHLQSLDEMRTLLVDSAPGRPRRGAPGAVPVRGRVDRAGGRALVRYADRSPKSCLPRARVPGILPPVRIDGEHFIDGGIVNSIPVSRAVTLGARQIYVLQVGRLEQSLQAAAMALGGRPRRV